MQRDLKRDIDFFYEIGTFRRIERMWKQVLGNGLANDAEHTFRVVWIAITIAQYEKNIDLLKIMKLALIHDLGEIRTGDKFYITNPYIQMNESKAIEDILSGTSIKSEFIGLMDEYKTRESLEAQIVKDADTLDVALELGEQKSLGNTLAEKYEDKRLQSIDSLYLTGTGKSFAKMIQTQNPHEWHLKFLPY